MSFEENVHAKVDDFLNKSRSSSGSLYNLMSTPESREALKILRHYELINQRSTSDNSIVDITLEGVRVIEAGGISNYLKTKQAILDAKTKKDNDKYDVDFANAIRVNKYFWLPLIISLFSLAITLWKALS